jgi:taurine dioxygenase
LSTLAITPHINSFGARVEGLRLNSILSDALVSEIKSIWWDYQVLYFPDQPLDHAQLEQFSRSFGNFGDDPYVQSIEGHSNILEVRREPDEYIAPFGGSWHSDWSFQLTPPSATILHAKIVPPVGGDTHYADSIRAYEALDPALRSDLEEMTTTHSARRSYSHQGYKKGGERTGMKILPSDKAWDTQVHPLVRTHPDSGRKGLWINPVYTLSINEISQTQSDALLEKLFAHILKPEFIYVHKWAENMLTMWDNRSVMHCAQGGYNGYRRVMHRTTIQGTQPF